MAFAKFQGNRFRIDREITENHASLVEHFNVTLGIEQSARDMKKHCSMSKLTKKCVGSDWSR